MNKQVVCSTCGIYYPAAHAPTLCTICMDEQQYIPNTGQSWTKPEDVHLRHSIKLNRLTHRLYEMEINLLILGSFIKKNRT